MAQEPADVATREIPPFSVAATVSSADLRSGIVVGLGFYNRALQLVGVTVWSHNSTFHRFGYDRVVVPNGAEFWRIATNFVAVEAPLQTCDVFFVTWTLAI